MSTSWRVEKLTKQDVAIRQLRQAIRLFFAEGDMLAVHTLTAAALGVLGDLARGAGMPNPFRDEEDIRPEMRAAWRGARGRTQNFLKHADKDPAGVLRYNEEETVLVMLEAVHVAQGVTDHRDTEFAAYFIWFMATYPDMVRPEIAEQLSKLPSAGQATTNRADYSSWLNSVPYR